MEERKCLSCSTDFTGSYCNSCGEKVYKQKDKSFVHIFEEIFHFLTHFEGTLLKSIRTMFATPGLYSLDYCGGVRKKYFKPVSLFILLVVLYLIFPIAQGLNMPLDSYNKSVRFIGPIERQMEKKKIDYPTLKAKYDAKSGKLSKFLLLIVLPFCGLLLMLLFYKKKDFYFDHFILSAEINSLFLMVMFIIIPVLTIPFGFIFGNQLMNSVLTDDLMAITAVLVLATYSTISFMRFYNTSFLGSAVRSLIFSAGLLFILLFVYRLLLFHSVMVFI